MGTGRDEGRDGLVMTNRERFVKTIRCEPTDRPLFYTGFGPWGQTVDRWRREGLPEGREWSEGFGYDPGPVGAPAHFGYSPRFERITLERRAESYVQIDTRGIKMECRNDGNSIPRFLEYPVKDYADWKKLRDERLDPDTPGRVPADLKEAAAKLNAGDAPVQVGNFPYGVFGTLRDLFGVETLLVDFYDEPDMIHEIMDYLTDLWIKVAGRLCDYVRVDCFHMWEDMSGKQGSLISPAMVREFMLPNYRKIRKFCDAHGVAAFSVDTDGNCDELVPVFMEAGVNWIYPFEVAAGCDVNRYRELYPKLCMMGGIDKQAIARGKDAIDAELARVAPCLEKPGYIAALDHLVHPEISWEDFTYYTQRLKAMIFNARPVL
jgi:uroporphyrinogen decarboxylase